MKLRNRVYGNSIISTQFDTHAALRNAVAEQEAMRLLSGNEEAEISDTEAITAAFRELGAIPKLPDAHKRRRSSPAPSTPYTNAPPLSTPSAPSSRTGSIMEPTAAGELPELPTTRPQTRAQAAKITSAELSSEKMEAAGDEQAHRNKRRRMKRRENRVVEKPKPLLERTLTLVGTMKEEEAGTPVAAKNLPAAGGGYTAKVNRDKSKPPVENYAKLMDEGFKLIEWDGRTPKALKDVDENIIVMLAGQPNAKDWDLSCKCVYDLMMKKGKELPRGTKYCEHVRGSFPAINVGVTHGKGSTAPHTLNHGDRVKEIVYDIIEDREMKRLASFQSSAFNTWAPKLYRHYEDYMDRLWSHNVVNKDGRLRKNFKNSVFPCIALNFGPRVWTKRHRDTKNLPYGWCAVTALGDFDAMKGGHLVLPDLKLVIQFPANSTIFIPSATLIHANTPVSKNESRVSFTQFCAGDIFRFIDCDFKTETDLAQVEPTKYAEHLQRKTTNWENGLRLYSKVKELESDVMEDFMVY